MKKIKKIIGLLLSVMLALTLCFISACAPEDEDPPPGPGETYQVVFDVNVGDSDETITNEPDAQNVTSGQTATKPTNPGRAGYDFGGWYTDAGCTTEFNFSNSITATITLYAKWSVTITYYDVTFNYNGGGTNATNPIEKGNTVTKPADPTRENYQFGGWYVDAGCATAYNFSAPVTSDITLYAKWTQIHTITFNLNYTGSTPISVPTLSGATVQLPADPTRDGYIFGGWYTDAGCVTAYTAGAVTSSFSVYAKWTASSAPTFNVTFNLNYDGAPQAEVKPVVENSAVVMPNDPTRENYVFGGWYTDTGCATAFVATTPITGALTLYAKWTASIIVTFNYNYENAPQATTTTVASGSAVTKPADPTRIGYDFAGWTSSAKGGTAYDFDAPVTSALTLYAQWSKQYVFEAEDLDFNNFEGKGFSGGVPGTSAIIKDVYNASASNGYYVLGLNECRDETKLTFTIYSDRAIENVSFIVRLSAEIKNITIVSAGAKDKDPVFQIKVNEDVVDYGEIDIDDVPAQSSGDVRPFTDYEMPNISLVEGKNTIVLSAENTIGQGGTMFATAPMVDCIKITTSAVLTWTPVNGNY